MANDEIDRLNDEIEAWVRRYDNAMIGRQMWREAAEAYERQTERLNAENARLREALEDARNNGLIYWEPRTERGYASRAQMLSRIDAALAEQEKK